MAAPLIRLSQCMIVKNEEENIERALSWGRGYVCEQIVVDTGSTDQTAAIARRMGARVYDFEWNDDFSAAKNFAIEKATGSWIAFLDADEYFQPDQMPKVMDAIDSAQKDQGTYFHVLRCTLSNLNDKGLIIAVMQQDRIFRNMPELRYYNRIHEQLRPASGELHIADFTEIHIMHTGYSESAYKKTRKTERNLRILEKELEKDPENYTMMSYLGESLMAKSEYRKAENLFKKVLKEQPFDPKDPKRAGTCTSLLRSIVLQEKWDEYEDFENYYRRVKEEVPDTPDADYYMGIFQMNRRQYGKAVGHLEEALRKQEGYKRSIPSYTSGALSEVLQMLADACHEVGDDQKATQYAVLSLRINRQNEKALCSLLKLLMNERKERETADGTFGFLQKLYDFNNLRDKLSIIKCAKYIGFYKLEDKVYDALTEEESHLLKEMDMPDVTTEALQERYGYAPCRNKIDDAFLRLLYDLENEDAGMLVSGMMEKFKGWDWEYQKKFPAYLRDRRVWGRLDPAEDCREAFNARVTLLKKNVERLLKVYERLSDYHSKKVWLSILKNWIYLDYQAPLDVMESSCNYYDADIISSDPEGTVVDVGSYRGKTVQDYMKTYGRRLKKMYCYEISGEAISRLKGNIRKYDEVEIRTKAAGKNSHIAYISYNENLPAFSTIADDGDEAVEVVAIDEDIRERISIMCIDTGDAVLDILEGCREHIIKDHPQMVINAAYGYEGVWTAMEKILELDDEYCFYLRHFSGNLIPSDYVLYAVENTKDVHSF